MKQKQFQFKKIPILLSILSFAFLQNFFIFSISWETLPLTESLSMSMFLNWMWRLSIFSFKSSTSERFLDIFCLLSLKAESCSLLVSSCFCLKSLNFCWVLSRFFIKSFSCSWLFLSLSLSFRFKASKLLLFSSLSLLNILSIFSLIFLNWFWVDSASCKTRLFYFGIFFTRLSFNILDSFIHL